MANRLTTINEMKDEHEAIRAQTDMVRRNMDRVLPDPDKAKAAAIQEIEWLREGVKNHYSHEEEVLPDMLGDLMMKALVVEHRRIQAQFDTILRRMSDSTGKGNASEIKAMVEDACRLIEEHSLREDAILYLLQRALEAENKSL